jgi:predicted transposase/invertase (TIGR01784 family)
MLDTLIKDDPLIGEAHKQYKHFTSDEKMRDLYEARLKYERDKKSLIASAENKGKLEGKIEGKIEGIKEGINKGKIEGKIEDVLSMYKDGLPLNKVAQYTSLPIEEIQKIIKDRA